MDNGERRLDYGQLLEDAENDRPVSPEIREHIRQQLRTRDFEADPYTLIHILGHLEDFESEPLIRQYLDFDDATVTNDPDMIRRIALFVYGNMWSRPEAFDIACQKAFDDPSPYVRLVAAPIIGHLGRVHPELKRRAAAALVKGLDRLGPLEQVPEEENVLWGAFYDGILDLYAIPLDERPLPTRAIREENVRRDLIGQARHDALE
jgi:hypothetical protein